MTTELKNRINRSISLGLDFLYKNQLPYGEFKTYLSFDKKMQAGCQVVSTTYITTFVLYSLSFIKDPRVNEMTGKAIKFLIEEMEVPGIWRFYGTNRDAKLIGGNFVKYSSWGIVPDLDDTACAAFCLKTNGVDIPDNRRVFLNNTNGEGLYYTWLMDCPKRKEYDDRTIYLVPAANDICCGVLSNILLYMGDTGDTEKTSEFIKKVVEAGEEENNIPYFPGKMILYYLLSRAFYNDVKSLGSLGGIVIKKLGEMEGTEAFFESRLSIAYAVCTFLNFGVFENCLHEMVLHLLCTQREDGSWQRERFCDGREMVFGSEELVTAICLEALTRYAEVLKNEEGS